MWVLICAACRNPWRSDTGWCACGAYDKDVRIDVVPAEQLAALKAFVRDVAEEPFYGGTPECSDRARALITTEEGDRA